LENVQNQGEMFGGREGFRRCGILKKKCKRHKRHPKMNLFRKFHQNRTMLKIGGKVWGEEGEFRRIGGGNFEKKMQTTQMASQNKFI